MSRVARIVVPGFPHHVTQRGNRRADVFASDSDREAYLRFLTAHCGRRGLAVWAYCLMSNHVHLVVVPETEASLSEGLRDAHTLYAMYFNSRAQMSGHLWQGRFYSCPMDDPHLWAAVRYVELNPVRANLTERAEQYPWSSAAAHCKLRDDPVLWPGLHLVDAIGDWAAWLDEPLEADETRFTAIRTQTHTGRPCGSDTFIGQIERILGRPARPKNRGPRTGTRYGKRKVT